MSHNPTDERIQQLIRRDAPAVPYAESLADRNCPVCGAGIHWDALNDPMKEAPKFCSNCGQRFDWRTEKRYSELFI